LYEVVAAMVTVVHNTRTPSLYLGESGVARTVTPPSSYKIKL